jgi:ribA/ribD-fused uncharacterized protein
MTIPSRADVIAAAASGSHAEFLFFWGHTASSDGEIGRWCLSQWYPATFTRQGVEYPTAEHYMMAEKARLFDDTEARSKIIACPTPAEAKKLGRGVRGFDPSRWSAHRFEIVLRGSLAKFEQDEALRAYLLGTGDAVLVEASPEDRIWGIGLSQDDERAADPTRWQGENLLGFALMEARAQIRGS